MHDPSIPDGEKKYVIKPELDEAKATRNRELVEKHKLLQQHDNKITRQAAQSVFDEYVKMSSDKQRRREYQVF
jgi:hypothetical protein